jgi:hypothetical protein
LHARRSLQKSGCDLQRRFVPHGGAYAPRSWCRANVCRRKNDFCDARTHVYKSGGREPAVGVREVHLQERFRKVAGDCRRCARERRRRPSSEPTGGLRPPLLRCSANVCRRKNDFCDARTHMHKSGGREPAVRVREAHLQERFRKVAGDCRRCARERRRRPSSEPTGGLRPPLLRCSASVCRRKTIFAVHERTFTRAAGVSPPWFREPSAVPRKPGTVR